jgi:hypothetical protein
MSIGPTHLGEAIVQKLIELQPNRFFELCNRPSSSLHGNRVYRETKLEDHGGRRFDGASRVDLIVPISATEALPVEVKLGETRLSKRRVDTEWLSACGKSHGDTAWTGNMMSILDQLIPPEETNQRLVAHVDGGNFRLTHEWCVVVRARTADAWAREGRPSFSRAIVVKFDDMAKSVGQTKFDSIVRELIDFPYYDTWITRADIG